MRILAALASLSLSFSALSAGSLTTLDVQENVVFFETSETKATSLSCVSSDNAALYSLSLNSDSGKAMYAMLMTAMSSGKAIEVISAGDCGIVDKVERAASIKFSEASMTATNKSQFNGTILENIKEPNLPLYNSSGFLSHDKRYFTHSKDSPSYRGMINNTNALNREVFLSGTPGSGWLTAIILPELKRDTNYAIIVEIDGVAHRFEGKFTQNRHNARPVMGLFKDTHIYTHSVGSETLAYVLASPAEVVSRGYGVPFYESVNVKFQIDTAPTNLEYNVEHHGKIEVLFGQPTP
ncbi:hypothetical protein OE749_01665 [Aestuariibacter sp. AA17]|uniref:Uncharacterized protein n=1 Tax=Fluctibacter corallii TaxID=2984329 RepID=A0ABT3A4E8_9ALTE|nr:hypothetical protein [Aestuariibacter sp. AA17]MCV2883404.1 hypothetical protein [Aestuariibacter sp. AA17]